MANQSKTGEPLGFEATLWAASDKLRGNLESAEYKHVVLGLIFLKYISDAFEERRTLLAEAVKDPTSDYYIRNPANYDHVLEDKDSYTAEGVFWVPPVARWDYLQSSAKQSTIGKLLDDAMDAVEVENPSLKGVLPKDYARPSLDKRRLGELIDLVGTIGLGAANHRGRDVLGRVYEYFLGHFASAEGKGGGEFYTPASVVKVLVEMLEPFQGRVYDPCCGSGGMFVQSLQFVDAHGGRRSALSIYGQEHTTTTWKLAKMNLAIRGIEANLGDEPADSFHLDKHPDLRADFILANPPFNVSDWGGERLRSDIRWAYGAPPTSNANFAWLQHMIHHLAPGGTAGVVLAVGSLISDVKAEEEIRKNLIESDIVDCVIALPSQLFYSTTIPVCLWFVSKGRGGTKTTRNRSGEVLFIDARKMGRKVSRTHRELLDDEIANLARTYQSWRATQRGQYADVPDFCATVSRELIRQARYALTPGLYVSDRDLDVDHDLLKERLHVVQQALEEALDAHREQEERTLAALAMIDAAVSARERIAEVGETKKLSDIARFVNGKNFTKDSTGDGRMIIRIAELNSGPGPSTQYTSIDAAEDYVARRGDLLFAWSGSLGVYRWTGPESLINQHIFKVIPLPGVPAWFVHFHVEQAMPKFRAIAADKATTMGHIRRGDLDDVLIPVPPADELARLDELLGPIWPLEDRLADFLKVITDLRGALLPSVLPQSPRAAR